MTEALSYFSEKEIDQKLDWIIAQHRSLPIYVRDRLYACKKDHPLAASVSRAERFQMAAREARYLISSRDREWLEQKSTEFATPSAPKPPPSLVLRKSVEQNARRHASSCAAAQHYEAAGLVLRAADMLGDLTKRAPEASPFIMRAAEIGPPQLGELRATMARLVIREGEDPHED